MRISFAAELVVVFAALSNSHILAEDTADEWVGKRVTVIKEDVRLFGDDGKPLAVRLEIGDWYQVRKTKGDKFWINQGWIRRADVVSANRAEDYLTAQIQQSPNAVVYHRRAQLRFRIDKYNQAVIDETEAIRLDPRFAAAYCVRGAAFTRMGKLDKAFSDFDESVRLDQMAARTYLWRAIAFETKQELERAMDDLNQGIQLAPRDPILLTARADLLFYKDDEESALRDIDEAIRTDPTYLRAYLFRCSLWLNRGEAKKALRDEDQAIQLEPECIEAHRRRAWLLASAPEAEIRDAAKAIESATIACRLTNWSEPDSLSALAAGYAEKGDFDPAQKWEREAIRLGPQSGSQFDEMKAMLQFYEAHKPLRMRVGLRG